MSGGPGYWPGAGRALLVLAAAGLAGGGPARAQQPSPPPAGPAVLARPVAPTPGNRPLGEVLAELSRQSRLPFSYSSSLIPVGRRYRLAAGPPRPLGAVLREVLAATHLSYGLLGGQLVLWPAAAALPAGVTAVNGYPARSGPPLPGRAAFAAQRPAPTARPAAAFPPARKDGAPALAAGPPAGTGAPLVAFSTPGPRRRTSSALGTAGGMSAGRRPGRPTAAPPSRAAPAEAANSPLRPGPAARANGQVAAGAARAAGQSSGARPRPAPPGSGGGLAKPLSRAAAGQRASASPQTDHEAARALTFLSPRISLLTNSSLDNNGLPIPASLATIQPARAPASPPAVAPGKRLDLANAWGHTYLRGEAWLSEGLPVGGMVKIGVQHAYLVLNAAIGPFDRRSGVAWGLGLGTAGRARGRFTPSVDLVAWALPSDDDDDDIRHARLVQLRPLLAWQLKRDGKVSLLLGPTLNLATAAQRGARRWSFGQDQWLWLNSTDDQSVRRLWPGVQAGVRF
ncbi:hypothetical protein ACFQ48_12035 [Hymenobacter caeli]|uniref:Secretin/TonB short N-terminal domain-containing protein n=1 Tax=Hymenobacter caeli TaxID=2735894 RepID=A0ABX2FMM8_9BACT|nr:hypothetical protein [Hymenobacter caeli]NRT18413.1 hypothetical protein [Hymenobacter caeli]